MRCLWISALLFAAGCGSSSADLESFDGSQPRDASVDDRRGAPSADAAGHDAAGPEAGGGRDADSGGTGATDAGGGAVGSPGCGAGTSALGPGDHSREIDVDGRTREYRLYVPEGYDEARPVPLVLDFHGYTSNASQQIALTGMTSKADAETFVTAHPEGWGLAQSWNGGACCGTAASSDIDDVALARAIVEELGSMLCIDRGRVYATGLSNGGFLSHRLACEGADFITAIAPVAGVLGVPREDCEPSRPISVMHFHGTADGIVPYDGGLLTGYLGAEDTMGFWAERNGCAASPEVSHMMGDTTCETWTGCDEGVEVTLCTVDGGGHEWPGGLGSFADIDATDHMWEMFARTRMP